jgi:hypothetical protein
LAFFHEYLTFKKQRLPERPRLSMFFTLMRRTAKGKSARLL